MSKSSLQNRNENLFRPVFPFSNNFSPTTAKSPSLFGSVFNKLNTRNRRKGRIDNCSGPQPLDGKIFNKLIRQIHTIFPHVPAIVNPLLEKFTHTTKTKKIQGSEERSEIIRHEEINLGKRKSRMRKTGSFRF